jgi:ferritin
LTKIKKLADEMLDEICSAKEYAEMYVEYKSKGDSAWANRFKEMATDELKHSGYLHELAVSEIDTLSKVFEPPQAMLDKWEKDHSKYVEKTAWVRQMLSM